MSILAQVIYLKDRLLWTRGWQQNPVIKNLCLPQFIVYPLQFIVCPLQSIVCVDVGFIDKYADF